MLLLTRAAYATVPYSLEATDHRGSPFRTAYNRMPQMGDGCRHVFLDVGANRGVHVRALMEPELFPGALFVKLNFWSQYFGQSFHNDTTVCAFGFEPNAAHAPRLERLAWYYRSAGRRVEFLHFGAKDRPGQLLMYDHRGDAAKSDWTFGSARKSHRPVNVSVIDLALWVKSEVIQRSIPDGASSSATRPAIIMKMDVEGDELPILQRMLDLGVLCDIDLVTWEYHDYLVKLVVCQLCLRAY